MRIENMSSGIYALTSAHFLLAPADPGYITPVMTGYITKSKCIDGDGFAQTVVTKILQVNNLFLTTCMPNTLDVSTTDSYHSYSLSASAQLTMKA
jgi:hypothetical protein